MDNLLVRATERPAYGWIDPRAMFASEGDEWAYRHTIWMAVSCCCGIAGSAEPVKLPPPEPRLPG